MSKEKRKRKTKQNPNPKPCSLLSYWVNRSQPKLICVPSENQALFLFPHGGWCKLQHALLTLEDLSQQTLEALPVWQSSECCQGLFPILWHAGALLRHLLASQLPQAHQVQLVWWKYEMDQLGLLGVQMQESWHRPRQSGKGVLSSLPGGAEEDRESTG